MSTFLPEPETTVLHERFASVLMRMEQATLASGRKPEDIALVAVSKKHPASMIAALLAVWRKGQPAFGENYTQEALQKQADVASLLATPNGNGLPEPAWHFIGHVQSRKARDIAGRFTLIHTLDSEKLATALCKAVAAVELPPLATLVQINIGREEQKAGVLPENAERLLQAILPMRELCIEGLMCIPPFDSDSRPCFVAMRDLRDKLAQATGLPLRQLSMGMSHDYEAAIAEGATIVRIGTDIFGPRPTQQT